MRAYDEGVVPAKRGSHGLSPLVEASLIGIVAALLLVPCFWQPHIIAGDLPSHVYNAWLATQIEQGKAQGLVLAHPITNVLADWAFEALFKAGGRVWAERVVAGAAVQIFFWGAFFFVAAVASERSWIVAPSLGMLAYGLIFQLGLLNFYIATGLSLWLMALLWRPRRPWFWLSVPLAALALLAHPLPLAWAAAALVYVHGVRRVPEKQRALVLLGGFCALVLAQTLLLTLLPTRWSLDDLVNVGGILGLVGVGQMWPYGVKYVIVVAGLSLIWFLLFLERIDRGQFLSDPVVHLWLLCMAALVLLPSGIQFPQYRFALQFVPERVSFFVAILFCAMVAKGEHGRSLTRASCLLAAVFFVALFLDMKSLNQVEAQVTDLVSTLPPGERVVAILRDSSDTRTYGMAHVSSGACIGHCWDYANYEPSTGQFRIQAPHPNGVVASDITIVKAIENGNHVVTPDEAPLYSVCPAKQSGRMFELRKLGAGDMTCLVTIPGTEPF
jgi:hypothetical protein